MKAAHEIIAEVYSSFNDRDIDAVLALLSDDVDWPNAMDNVRVHGRDEVRAYWTRQWSLVNPRVEPVRIEEEAEQTVVDVHQVVCDLAGNVLVDQIVQHVYRIQEGLIRRMDIR